MAVEFKPETLEGMIKNLLVEIGLDSPKYTAHSLKDIQQRLCSTFMVQTLKKLKKC